MRLDKMIALTGISRKDAKKILSSGRVKVNAKFPIFATHSFDSFEDFAFCCDWNFHVDDCTTVGTPEAFREGGCELQGLSRPWMDE